MWLLAIPLLTLSLADLGSSARLKPSYLTGHGISDTLLYL